MVKRGLHLVLACLLVLLLAGCSRLISTPTATPTVPPAVGLVSTPAATPTTVPSTVALLPTAPATSTPAPPSVPGLTADQVATLNSLEQVSDYPLYVMHYQGAYGSLPAAGSGEAAPGRSAWGCSLFAALGDANNRLYGRNFDWDFSPALLLFTDPPDGYASVSLVDIAYLGFTGSQAQGVADLPLAERQALLYTPLLPFDGLNEYGLAVGMAAVPAGSVPPDPDKPTIDSLGVIRQMLDQARTVDEALAILSGYNVDMSGGPDLHYLLADATGRALLVEFYQGQMAVLANESPWHLATNFLRVAAGESAAGRCRRYDQIEERLTAAAGRLTAPQAMDLLSAVSQPNTQWSAVYGLSTGDIRISLGRQYDQVYESHLDLATERP